MTKLAPDPPPLLLTNVNKRMVFFIEGFPNAFISFAALKEFPDEYGATEEDGKRCLEYRWLQSENFTEGWKYNEKLQR